MLAFISLPICAYDSHLTRAICLDLIWGNHLPEGEGTVAQGRHMRDQAIIILLFYVHSGSSYCIQFSNALVLRYTYRRMRMRKCGVTMWCVVNRITGPRAAVHAHTPKSCTYNRATRRVRGTVHWKTLSLASSSTQSLLMHGPSYPPRGPVVGA